MASASNPKILRYCEVGLRESQNCCLSDQPGSGCRIFVKWSGTGKGIKKLLEPVPPLDHVCRHLPESGQCASETKTEPALRLIYGPAQGLPEVIHLLLKVLHHLGLLGASQTRFRLLGEAGVVFRVAPTDDIFVAGNHELEARVLVYRLQHAYACPSHRTFVLKYQVFVHQRLETGHHIE